MIVAQRGSVSCSRAPFVCVKRSTQEERWGSPSVNFGRRSEGDTGGRGRGRAEAGLGRHRRMRRQTRGFGP